MVMCKFFQQGSCRYGQNCRFEHIYGSKYTYHANAPQQAAPSAPVSVTDEQLINQVHSDVQAALRGNQWLLSSYAPFKEKPAFPGLTDLSPEEARLFIYEAKASNNLDVAVAHMNNLFKDARTKYEQLLLKNPNITRVFRSLYKGENVPSPFGNVNQENTAFGNNASSLFRSAIQTSPFEQNSPSVFNQNNSSSVFAQNNATPSIFAQNNSGNTDPAKSIFAQANHSSFSTSPSANVFAVHSPNNISNLNVLNSQGNIFGPQTESAKSIFAQATQSVFAAPNAQSTPSSLFQQANASQSIFQTQQSTPLAQNQTNMFQNSESQNAFGLNQNVFHQANPNDISIYSNMEDLSAEDIEAFKSDDFKMGFIPELPPPHSLCI